MISKFKRNISKMIMIYCIKKEINLKKKRFKAYKKTKNLKINLYLFFIQVLRKNYKNKFHTWNSQKIIK